MMRVGTVANSQTIRKQNRRETGEEINTAVARGSAVLLTRKRWTAEMIEAWECVM